MSPPNGGDGIQRNVPAPVQGHDREGIFCDRFPQSQKIKFAELSICLPAAADWPQQLMQKNHITSIWTMLHLAARLCSLRLKQLRPGRKRLWRKVGQAMSSGYDGALET